MSLHHILLAPFMATSTTVYAVLQLGLPIWGILPAYSASGAMCLLLLGLANAINSAQ
jgi:hypothetical protein